MRGHGGTQCTYGTILIINPVASAAQVVHNSIHILHNIVSIQLIARNHSHVPELVVSKHTHHGYSTWLDHTTRKGRRKVQGKTDPERYYCLLMVSELAHECPRCARRCLPWSLHMQPLHWLRPRLSSRCDIVNIRCRSRAHQRPDSSQTRKYHTSLPPFLPIFHRHPPILYLYPLPTHDLRGSKLG